MVPFMYETSFEFKIKRAYFFHLFFMDFFAIYLPQGKLFVRMKDLVNKHERRASENMRLLVWLADVVMAEYSIV